MADKPKIPKGTRIPPGVPPEAVNAIAAELAKNGVLSRSNLEGHLASFQDPTKDKNSVGALLATTGKTTKAKDGRNVFDDVGDFFTGGDKDQQARDQLRLALQEFGDIRVPTQQEQAVELENLRMQGMLAPEMEMSVRQGATELGNVDPVLQGDSEYWNIETDPALKAAQRRALEEMSRIGTEGGMTAEDRARYAQIQGQQEEAARGQREAVMQDMRARGMAGSGMELLGQLNANQAAAGRASQQGLDLEAMAERRALEALSSAGQLGGQIRQQEFGEQAQQSTAQDAINRYNTQSLMGLQMDRAQAQDTINNYNTGNQQAMTNRNVDRFNTAQQQNLSNAQRVADTNVGLRNQQQQHNRGLAQQQFNNRLQRASGMSGQYQNLAGAYNQQAENQRGLAGNLWDAVTKTVGAAT